MLFYRGHDATLWRIWKLDESGAIDFGLIVDGAVIIVEATMHHLGTRALPAPHTNRNGRWSLYIGQSVHRSSALVKLLFWLCTCPFFSLVGVEGKMFKPMAQTVSFAILGAFILSLTYVPMMSALVMSKNRFTKRNFLTAWWISFIGCTKPVIRKAIHNKFKSGNYCVGVFVGAVLLFTSLGKEFLPTLDEGDFAVDTRVLTGSSLNHGGDGTRAGLLMKEYRTRLKSRDESGFIRNPHRPDAHWCQRFDDYPKTTRWLEKSWKSWRIGEKWPKRWRPFRVWRTDFSSPFKCVSMNLSRACGKMWPKIFGEDLNTLTDLAKPSWSTWLVALRRRSRFIHGRSCRSAADCGEHKPRRIGALWFECERSERCGETGFSRDNRPDWCLKPERRFDLVVRLNEQKPETIGRRSKSFRDHSNGQASAASISSRCGVKSYPIKFNAKMPSEELLRAFNVHGRDIAEGGGRTKTKSTNSKVPAGYYPTYGGRRKTVRSCWSINRLLCRLRWRWFCVAVFTFNSVSHRCSFSGHSPWLPFGCCLCGFAICRLYFGWHWLHCVVWVAVLNGIVLISEFNRLKKQMA